MPLMPSGQEPPQAGAPVSTESSLLSSLVVPSTLPRPAAPLQVAAPLQTALMAAPLPALCIPPGRSASAPGSTAHSLRCAEDSLDGPPSGVKADTSDWDPAATLAALSGSSNDRSAAGLLAELGGAPGDAQPTMPAALTAANFSDLRIRFVDQEVHRTVTEPASGQTENEVSNLRPFRLKVAVRTSEGHPPPMVRLMLRVSLVVESPDAGVQAVQPFLSQEDARSPLLVGLDGSPAQPVAVKPDGIATFTLKLGKNALSSKVNNRRFSLLVQLDLPVEQLAHAPNLMVLSPPFKGLTRLRLRAGDARADRLAIGLDAGAPGMGLLAERIVEDDVAAEPPPPIVAATHAATTTTVVKRSHGSGAPNMSDLHQMLLETRRLLDQTRAENADLRARLGRLEQRFDGPMPQMPQMPFPQQMQFQQMQLQPHMQFQQMAAMQAPPPGVAPAMAPAAVPMPVVHPPPPQPQLQPSFEGSQPSTVEYVQPQPAVEGPQPQPAEGEQLARQMSSGRDAPDGERGPAKVPRRGED